MAITIKVSERTMRRVQITMAAMQGVEQTAQATAQAAQNMVAQARKSLDEALGTICDAHDEVLPSEYRLSVNLAESTLTIAEMLVATPDAPADVRNGTGHTSAPAEASEGIQA